MCITGGWYGKVLGRGFYGQLGDGTTTYDQPEPVNVIGLRNVVALTASNRHTCALLEDSTVKCWGWNGDGRLGDGTTTRRVEPVSVVGLTNVVTLVSGASHTCALLEDSTVKCWGSNGNGQLGDGTTVLDNPEPVNVEGLINVTALAANYGHTCAVLKDGPVKCWGSNGNGALGDGTSSQRSTPVAVIDLDSITSEPLLEEPMTVAALAAGSSHTCALLGGGTVQCWGANIFGQIGDGTTTPASNPVSVKELTNVTAIAAGDDHTCVLLEDSTVKCWGDGYSQLEPGNVIVLSNVVTLDAGGGHTCVVSDDSTVKCRGRN